MYRYINTNGTTYNGISDIEFYGVPKEATAVTPDMIVARVAKKYGVSKEDIYGRQRTKHIATARNISIYIIRKITGISFPMIGDLFERDHSTIISANNTVEANVKSTPLFAMEINDLIKEITE